MIGLDDLLILILATWRVSSLLVTESGPWDILARLRHRLGVRYDATSQPYGRNILAGALTCPWCTSVWVGLGLAAIQWYGPFEIRFWALVPLAVSGGAILVQRWIDG